LLRFARDAQTKEFLLSGAGQQHVEVTVSKLKRRFNLEVTLKAPKIPYRETIRAKAEAQGKHKKQTGGHGQYGDCWIKVEPLVRGAGFADCAPIGDVALAAALQKLTGADERPDPDEVANLMRPFAPHRSLATCHLWASLRDAA